MADIVLKDRNGKNVTYSGIETVTFDTPTEGKQATFTEGVAVDGLEIVPDFSGGDMAVIAPDGMLVKSATIKKPDDLAPENIRNGFTVGGIPGSFIGDTEEQTVPLAMADGDMVIEPSALGKVLSKVVIQKPETLLPENIAEGIDISGIIGTFKGVGKIASGKVNYNSITSGEMTISHNLGVVPDVVFIGVTAHAPGYVWFGAGISQALQNKIGNKFNYYAYANSASGDAFSSTSAIDKTTTGPGIHSTTETEFRFGNDTYPLCNLYDYPWIAIGGLT